MIIRSLRLQNFRRFADVLIEPGDGVTAIIGRNGSGKSTIVEAIGFALFGSAATRTNNALLRHTDAAPGDAVSVTMELELAGQAVAIHRELRGVNLTPRASLTVDGKTLVAPGGNSNAAATQEIERILKMDRHAFVTTVVAQQKELARLADLPAADRKQLILRMLGIDNLDKAIQAARDKRRMTSERLEGLRSMAPDVKALKASAAECKNQIEGLETSVKESTKTVSTAERELIEISSKLKTIREANQARTLAAAEARQAEAAVNSATSILADARERVKAAHEAKESANAFADAPTRRATAQKQLEQAAAVDAQRQAFRQAIERHEKAKDALAILRQNRPENLPAPRPLEPVANAADHAQTAHREAETKAALANDAQRRAKQQLERLTAASDDADCPVCGRPLAGHKEKLLQEYQRELAAAIEGATTARELLQSSLRAQTLAQTELATLQQLHQEYTRSLERHERFSQQLEAAQNAVALAEKEVANPPPEAPDISALRAEAEQASRDELQRERLLSLASNMSSLQAALTTAEDKVKLAQEAQTTSAARLAELGPTQPSQKLEADEAQATQSLNKCRASLQKETLNLELARQKLLDLEKRIQEAEEGATLIRKGEHEVRIWTALAGGRGQGLLERFRSHLVGKIRPAINAEASRLLASFTAGRYSEIIVDEDYGIFVVDGATPYSLERFSGGETDLVHLALRLAVSRLLTQRSGAPELRFLALDEVFGSLDDQRRDAVLGALHGLSGLYRQVLLVTHHEAMRDSLDATLEVRTEGNESVIVAHQG